MITDFLRALQHTGREARLYLITSALFGFAIFGGIYTTLFNLYLVRLGYQADFAGTVNGIGQFAFGLVAVPTGLLGRHTGSRRLLITGLSLMVIGFGLTPLAEFLPLVREGWIIWTYLVGQVGIAIYFVNGGPFVRQVTSPFERNHVYALSIALWPLAGFAGSLVGGLLPELFAGLLAVAATHPAPYRYALILATLLLLPAILAMILAHEAKPTPEPVQSTHTLSAPLLLIGLIGVIVLLRVVGEGVVRTFFNLYLDSDLRLSTVQIGALMGIGQLLAVPASLIMPAIAARWGNGLTYLTCTWGMIPSLILIALVPNWITAGLGYMSTLALIGLARPAIVAFQLDIVGPQWRTLMAGATTTAVGLGWAIASLGGGYLITRFGYGPLFMAGALLSALGSVLFWLYFRPQPPQQASRPASP